LLPLVQVGTESESGGPLKLPVKLPAPPAGVMRTWSGPGGLPHQFAQYTTKTAECVGWSSRGGNAGFLGATDSTPRSEPSDRSRVTEGMPRRKHGSPDLFVKMTVPSASPTEPPLLRPPCAAKVVVEHGAVSAGIWGVVAAVAFVAPGLLDDVVAPVVVAAGDEHAARHNAARHNPTRPYAKARPWDLWTFVNGSSPLSPLAQPRPCEDLRGIRSGRRGVAA
jgi:hypothetical protein